MPQTLDWLDPRGDPRPVIDPAARMRRWAASAGVRDDPLLPRLALAGFGDAIVQALCAATGGSACGWHRDTAIGELDGAPVAVVSLRPGAPMAVGWCEEVIAAGVRTLLIGGAVGSLQRDLTIGHYVVPTSAIREEGTSLHYVPPDHQPRAEGPATRALVAAAQASDRQVSTGRVWTTDAPYREFTGKVRQYAEQGVLGVEMEASALMTLAELRGVDLGLLLTVSDHVFDPAWPNIFGSDQYRENCAQLAGILLDAARRLLSVTP